MCELGVLPIFFLENHHSKVDKIIGYFSLRQEKPLKDWKRCFFPIYCSWIFGSMQSLQLPVVRVGEARYRKLSVS